jgi:hypothetical protein
MTCANCGGDLPDTLTPVKGLVSCPTCLRTVVLATGEWATGKETLGLSTEQLAALRAQRKEARKAKANG